MILAILVLLTVLVVLHIVVVMVALYKWKKIRESNKEKIRRGI